MTVQFLGALSLGKFRAGFFVVVSNLDLIRCQICGRPFLAGERISKAWLEGLPAIDHHVRCSAECRRKLYAGGKVEAGGRAPLAG